MALSSCAFLLSVHMSDNGLRSDQELFIEVLEIFGLEGDILNSRHDDDFETNKRCKNIPTMKKIIKEHI